MAHFFIFHTQAPAASLDPEAGSDAAPEAAASLAMRSVELVRDPHGLGLSVDRQYKVVAIEEGSQAQRSGFFAVQDQLVSLNSQPLSGGGSFEEQLGAFPVGTRVKIEIGSPGVEGARRRRKQGAAGASGADASGAAGSPQPSATLYKRSRIGTYKQVEVMMEGAILKYLDADQSVEIKSSDVDRIEVVNNSRLEFALHVRKRGSAKIRPIVFRATEKPDFARWVSDLGRWLDKSDDTATPTTSQ